MKKRTIRIISQEDVKKCIDMKQAIPLQRKAFCALSPKSTAVTPERTLLQVPGEGITLFKPAYFEDSGSMKDNEAAMGVLGCKVVSVRAKNNDSGLPTVVGSIMLFDVKTGFTKGLIDAEYLTGLRTAAGSGVFTDIYAEHNASKLVIFGAGLQAEEHFKAVMEVRSTIKEVVVINRTEDRARALIQKLKSSTYNNSNKRDVDIQYNFCSLNNEAGVREALLNANILCCCTNSSEPLFKSEWIENNGCNVHINAIGSYTPEMQEVPDNVIMKAIHAGVVVCDSNEALTVGEFKNIPKEGLKRVHVACDILDDGFGGGDTDTTNVKAGVKSKTQRITIFKSVGTSIQDVVTSGVVFQNAQLLNIGTLCPL